jgi:hypothetical protein
MRTRHDGMTANSQIYSIKTPPSDKNPIKINSLILYFLYSISTIGFVKILIWLPY